MQTQVIDIHKELILQAQEGIPSAQKELYKSYCKAMYNTCLRMLNDEAEAQDALQESFISAFSRLESFRFESSFGAWLKRIVVNQCINMLRKSKGIISLTEKIPEGAEEDSYDEAPDPYLTVERIKAAMQTLPDGARTVFDLYLFEGYSHAEIAELMGTTEATSKSQFRRAKALMRDKLVSREKLLG